VFVPAGPAARRRRRIGGAASATGDDSPSAAVSVDGETPPDAATATLDTALRLLWLPELPPTPALAAIRDAPLDALLAIPRHLGSLPLPPEPSSPRGRPAALAPAIITMHAAAVRHLGRTATLIAELAPSHMVSLFECIVDSFAECQGRLGSLLERATLAPAGSSSIQGTAEAMLQVVHAVQSIVTVARNVAAHDGLRAEAQAWAAGSVPAVVDGRMPLKPRVQHEALVADLVEGHLARLYAEGYNELLGHQSRLHAAQATPAAGQPVAAVQDAPMRTEQDAGVVSHSGFTVSCALTM
jgi:hypothetical protein